MKRFNSKQIRNVALLGHSSSGKTSLAESMLYYSKAIQRLGSISGGNTVCDFDPEEIKRKVSIFTSVAPFEWQDFRINIIDTPGQPDFEGETIEGLRAADSVVIAVSGKSGVHVGTEKAWEKAKAANLPTAFFVGKLDEKEADFFKVLEELKSAFGAVVCPIIVPFEQNGEFVYINLIEMIAYKYKNGVPTQVDMPETGHRLQGLIAAVSEAVAETDDKYFDKYFSGESFTKQELTEGVFNGIKQGVIAPVFCGSALTGAGIDILINGIVAYFPGADGTFDATGSNGDVTEINVDENEPLAALVFKTVADPYVGKLSYVKVFSGKLTSDSTVVDSRTGSSERVGKLYYMSGKKQTETDCITAGDIGAIAKMNSPLTGDTLCTPSRVVSLEGIEFPRPSLSMAVLPAAKGDEDKIAQGLHRLMMEDPTLKFETNAETKQQIISGLGEQHIDVAVSKLKSKFGVSIQLTTPEVPYRESIRKKVTGEGKHKKQTGGHGQYGHVVIEFEPCDSEEMVFEEKVVGGAVPKNYFPAVEKGLRDCVKHGVIAGYPMVHLKATLLDGSYHPVDSSEMAFKQAAALAYKAGIPNANPVLLEPIGTLRAKVPESTMGDVIGEINKRRGRVLGMDPADKGQNLIQAEVPMAEMQDFTIILRSITKGRGSFTFDFERYEEAPPQVAQAVAAANSAKKQD
jgi:elongation factor G